MEGSGWQKVLSKSKQKHYWFNQATGKTQWEEPVELRRLDGEEESSGSLDDANKKRKREEGALLGAEKRQEVGERASAEPSGLKKVAIIVPFRDLHTEQKRAEHLKRFIPEIARFLSIGKNAFHIYIVEQSNDGRKFNRGKLLNIGFELAKNDNCGIFIFHDVDLIPSQDLLQTYTKDPDESGPIHIARVWNRYSKNPEYFGGIVSFSLSQFRSINGFPNNYWGWGGEDDEMKRRIETVGLKTTHPTEGSIEDMEEMTLPEKLEFLKGHADWKCMMKWELRDEHAETWRTNGINNLVYNILKKREIADKCCSIVTVDVMLNNHPLTDEKSLL